MTNTQITFDNFFPENVTPPPVELLPAFKAMLKHLESGRFVSYMCTAMTIVFPELKKQFADYVTEDYLIPNAYTNNFYNFYRFLVLNETGTEPDDAKEEDVLKLRINWLKAAIANIEARTKPRVKRAMKLSDTKVYKVLKKGLADNPSEFQKVYKGLKWAWDTFPDRHNRSGIKREVEFNKNLGCISYWPEIPVGNWDYWRKLAYKFFPNWRSEF